MGGGAVAAVADSALVAVAGLNPYLVTGLTLVGGGLGAIAIDGHWGDFFRGVAVGGATVGMATGAAELASKVAPKRKAKEPEKRNANFTQEEARRILKEARDLAERTERTDDGERRQARNVVLIPIPPHLARNLGGGRLYMRAL